MNEFRTRVYICACVLKSVNAKSTVNTFVSIYIFVFRFFVQQDEYHYIYFLLLFYSIPLQRREYCNKD